MARAQLAELRRQLALEARGGQIAGLLHGPMRRPHFPASAGLPVYLPSPAEAGSAKAGGAVP
jgi:hypothetical protein